MSVPEVDKRSTHHVVRMVYDKQTVGRFFVLSLFFSILLVGMLGYTLSVIDDQSEDIRHLAKIVNQLAFKVQQQEIDSLRGQGVRTTVHEDGQETVFPHTVQIEHILQLHHKELKKLYALVNKMEHSLTNDLKSIKKLLQEQKESSWEMKQIISSLKKNIQAIGKTFESIDFSLIGEKLNYLKPDFQSMGESIKGTFDNIRDRVGNMFEGEEKTANGPQSAQNQRKDQGGFGSRFGKLKDKIKEKINSWKSGNQKQL